MTAQTNDIIARIIAAAEGMNIDAKTEFARQLRDTANRFTYECYQDDDKKRTDGKKLRNRRKK